MSERNYEKNLDDMKEQDSYSIYDNIVRKALPKYINLIRQSIIEHEKKHAQ